MDQYEKNKVVNIFEEIRHCNWKHEARTRSFKIRTRVSSIRILRAEITQ